MPDLVQDISLQAFDGTVETVLGVLNRDNLNGILSERKPYRQLRYIVDYLNQSQIGAKSFLCESHYVDRDYMEDYGVFYSRSLHAPPNYCNRLHFFSLPLPELQEQIKCAAESSGASVEAQAKLNQSYKGFVVVKPILGAPIGRTVLVPLPRDKEDGAVRHFGCTREYTVHLLGFTLKVLGLAFQQQDEGVSACATTAIWSVLQKIRDFEDIRVVTPAEITILATRHILPFGRAMPSEGLTIDQMCQAIQALGLAPSLYRIEAPEDLLSYVHAAERSGFPSILVWDDNPNKVTSRHAVAVAGIKMFPAMISTFDGLNDVSSGVTALYVHDDRIGPYLRTDVDPNDQRHLTISYQCSKEPEPWWTSYVLLPVHPKIRLSFVTLRTESRKFAVSVQEATGQLDKPLSFEYFIRQGHRYVEDELRKNPQVKGSLGLALAGSCPLPRYLGVIRVSTDTQNWIDLLLDTTCAPRNIECVAIVCNEQSKGTLTAAATRLGGLYTCKVFTSH